MTLTKDQIAEAIETLSYPWGFVKLICDGYRVTLSVERAKGMTYRVMTYVNGCFKGVWMQPSAGTDIPEQKFLRRSERAACSKTYKAEMEKRFGKRHIQEDPFYSRTIVMYSPDWASGKAALSHLCKVCASIEIDPDKGDPS